MRRQRTNKFNSKKIKMNELITPLEQSMKTSNRTHSLSVQLEDQPIQAFELSQNTQDESQKMSEIVNKLISKNKINSKNAFNVPLVNINNLRSYQSDDDGAWSIYSSVLEGSAKVYGYRVDGMSENINRLSQNILRNIKTQNESPILEQNKQIEYHHLRKSNDFKDFKLQMHIEIQKTQHDQTFIQIKPSSCHCKLRRLLDQNGISGLILGTIPIGSDLSIDIYHQLFSMRKSQQSADEMVKIQVRNTSLQFNIAKQIQNLSNSIRGISYKRANQNDSMTDLDFTYRFILEQFQNTCFQRKMQEQTEVQEGNIEILELQVQIDEISKFDVNLILQTEKQLRNIRKKTNKVHITNKVMNSLPKKQRIHQNSYKQIAFLPDIQLSRNQILGLNPKIESKQKRIQWKEKIEKNILPFNCVYRQNLRENQFIYASFAELVEKETIYEISLMEENELINENNNMVHTVLENYGQNEDYCEEDQKCLNIKQNKLQLNKLLQKMQNQIKFSHLHHLHKQVTLSSNQAIDFLTVLHLSNQLSLTLLQINSIDFFIRS